ncbi:MAG: efflux family protein [Ramlibacter sp.]|nr:efflux family protein [Ramlibacter sp.]
MTPLLAGPILPALLRLALPNVLAMAAAAAVGIGETFYVGLLGLEPLAAMAVVFPFVMLTQMFSSGAMGGGVSSAVSRAIGAGDPERARTLATHAVVIGASAGLVFTALFLLGGPVLYRWLGARAGVLDQAVLYSQVVFCGALPIWLCNTLISVLRGAGNMRIPSATILVACVVQVAIGAGLGLGLGPLPKLGMAGIALGQVIAYTLIMAFLFWYLIAGPASLRLSLWGVTLRRGMFHDILKVGALACLSPLQTVLVIMIVTALVARYGVQPLAGYGIGARLEFLLVPIAFGVGVAAVPMVGMAIGAGDVQRARRVAWVAGAVSACVLGSIGLLVSLLPDAWAALFTSDAQVLASARQYLRWAGPAFAFFGLGLTLYFASQGSGKVLGPVLAASARLVFVAGVGALLVWQAAPVWTLFALVGAAMAVYGLVTAAAVYFTVWGTPQPVT